MSADTPAVRLPAVITETTTNRRTAQVGWVTGEGPTVTHALHDAHRQIQAGLVGWKRPELIRHGMVHAVLYTRPDGTAAFDSYNDRDDVPMVVGASLPNWDDARRAAHDFVARCTVDRYSDDSVYAGWDFLVAAGYSDLARELLRAAGYARAYRHSQRTHTNLDMATDTAYANEHAAEHIPTGRPA